MAEGTSVPRGETPLGMETTVRDMPALELALLRRGVDELAAGCERCRHCHRTPLIGERVYVYEGGGMLCELCRSARTAPAGGEPHRARAGVRPHDADHRSPRRGVAPRPPIESGPWNRSRSRRRSTSPARRSSQYLADIANHPEFTDHYMVDWHLTREDSYGTGAGARFRIKAPLRRFAWADFTFAEVQAPFRIVERGRGGKYNRIKMLQTYTLSPGPSGTTKVEYTLETLPGARVRPRARGDRRTCLDAPSGVPGAAPAADHP